MQVPSKAELERFFGAERADDVQFLETVASWPTLRILDHLYANEPASTGEIARALNMDMRDVKDRLEALQDRDIVAEYDDGWISTTDQITMTVARSEGIGVSYALGDRPPEDTPTDQRSTDTPSTPNITKKTDRTPDRDETDEQQGLVDRIWKSVTAPFR